MKGSRFDKHFILSEKGGKKRKKNAHTSYLFHVWLLTTRQRSRSKEGGAGGGRQNKKKKLSRGLICGFDSSVRRQQIQRLMGLKKQLRYDIGKKQQRVAKALDKLSARGASHVFHVEKRFTGSSYAQLSAFLDKGTATSWVGEGRSGPTIVLLYIFSTSHTHTHMHSKSIDLIPHLSTLLFFWQHGWRPKGECLMVEKIITTNK